jgi:hypothetical protein
MPAAKGKLARQKPQGQAGGLARQLKATSGPAFRVVSILAGGNCAECVEYLSAGPSDHHAVPGGGLSSGFVWGLLEEFRRAGKSKIG